MVVKKKSNAPKEVGLKDVKKDMLKLIDSVDALEQKIINVSHRVKKLEARVGIPSLIFFRANSPKPLILDLLTVRYFGKGL